MVLTIKIMIGKEDINYENVLLIGDSFLLGACVKENQNIGSLIKKKTNKKILTLANNGAGPICQTCYVT